MIRPLQKALTVEAENGFVNLHGREDYFNCFLVHKLSELNHSLLSNDQLLEIEYHTSRFRNYSNLSLAQRRRCVIDLRKYLYKISQSLSVPDTVNPPKLVISNFSSSFDTENKSNTRSLSLESSLDEVKGIGAECFRKLSKSGLITVRDLLSHYPRDYVDYSNLKRISSLKAGETATIVANVRRCSAFKSPRNPNLSILELFVYDITGKIKIVRFFAGKRFTNRSFLKQQTNLLTQGSTVAVSGLVKDNQYGKTFTNPSIEILDNRNTPVKSNKIGRLLALYNLPEGYKVDRFRKLIYDLLPLSSSWEDPLNPSLLSNNSLISKSQAIKSIHLPENQTRLKQAKRRLVFDEFLFMQLGLLRRRIQLRSTNAPTISDSEGNVNLVKQFFDLLPFALTDSQLRVLSEIETDLSLSEPMSRLLQGDVGSGKTIIAIASLLYCVQSGWQGAFMAPTEVLANQHYKNLCKWLPELNVTVELLTGSTSTTKRRQLLNDLSSGTLNILVGTHALIEDPVSFCRLGLVVVDEQHRFGVHQRNTLINKGLRPHLLTMTATPIPRTLALSIHGDLDVSQITELPPGRTPIKTSLLNSSSRDKAYALVKNEILKGQQAYFVLPLVEESEKLDLRSAINVFHDLSANIYPSFSVGLLHGRMSGHEKNSIINEFLKNQIQILVSTTVIEVGVDVPEATVIVIDHAERFGLAQLHQLRGRVGRSNKPSRCILINGSSNQASTDRLKVLVNSNDGFEISEIDLSLRGPGQVLGSKQSGLPDFALANLIEDEELLGLARNQAREILSQDPDLKGNTLLKKLLDNYWNRFSSSSHLN